MRLKAIGVVVLPTITAAVAWTVVGCSVQRYDSMGSSSLRSTIAPASIGRSGGIGGQPRGSELLPPQSLPCSDDELWVIPRQPQDRAAPRSTEPMPGQGQLMARRKEGDGQKLVPVPLKRTDVQASVIGYIATVDVKQQYHNPYNDKIEALYVFPLPQNAAVNEFLMTVGQRRIRGIIRERREAEAIYREAKGQGYVASLLTQERPNVFTQAVANIEPGKRIDIDIRYFNTLDYRDGAYEFVFPMVVGPRFNPPGYSDGIGPVARGDYGASGQKTEIQYLRPEERSGHDISLSLNIDAGVPIENIDSRNHKVSINKRSPEKAEVALDPGDSIPNRDFVLRYQVAGKATKPTLFAQRQGNGGYFTLMLFPPALLDDLPRQPLEFVFTIDVSGSANAIMAQYFERISHPALTDIAVDWGSAQVHDVFPKQLPDLYVGRPVVLTGRFEGNLPRSITLRGKLAGREQRIEVPIRQADQRVETKALSAVWARMKIADLADRAAYENGIDPPGQIRQLALEHSLMTAYTAFIAVDSLTRTSGDHGATIAVPVPVPQGVRYDTTVQEAGTVRQAKDGAE